VALYPDPVIYSGDRVTFDVTPRNLDDLPLRELTVRVYAGTGEDAEAVAQASVGYPTFDRVPRARMAWTWDTAGLVGEQTLTAWIDPDDRIRAGDEDPDNNRVTFQVEIEPAADRHPAELGATWAITTTDCCIFYYLSGTAAERDLATIAGTAAAAVDYVESELRTSVTQPFEIYLVSRVIGHGGYAQDWLAISYLDRHYGGRDLANVLRHEAVHVVDAGMIAEWAPALAREGLAVTVAGGHFAPGPTPELAAAVVALDRYIPLEELAHDFYYHQHEIGYLEAGAFVTYLLETHGWDDFRRFYTSFDPELGTDPEALDAALAATWGGGLAETESAFLDWLARHPPRSEHRRSIEGTVRLFDAVRSYQARYEPGAYFWSGWLPNPEVGEARGIVADFVRHPRQLENVALETMLIAAQEASLAGDWAQMEQLLDGVETVLSTGGFEHSLAADYLAVARAVADAGYEAQEIALVGDVAEVEAIADWPEPVTLCLSRDDAGWALCDK
jgi:hypothetical protein